MAGPGDHQGQDGAGQDDPDAEVGFCTPAALVGQPRAAIQEQAAPQPTPELLPESLSEPPPESSPESLSEPALEAAPFPTAFPQAEPAWPETLADEHPADTPPAAEAWPPSRQAAFAPAPAHSPAPVEEVAPYGRRGRARPRIEGETGLYAVYAMILLTVPTLGVSAALGLLAILGRAEPEDEAARSHFVYQRRTLFTGALAALLGVILIVVGLGVFVLFALAVWITARGAYGVLRLKADHAVPRPRSWLF